jgi:hypothetical protein
MVHNILLPRAYEQRTAIKNNRALQFPIVNVIGEITIRWALRVFMHLTLETSYFVLISQVGNPSQNTYLSELKLVGLNKLINLM